MSKLSYGKIYIVDFSKVSVMKAAIGQATGLICKVSGGAISDDFTLAFTSTEDIEKLIEQLIFIRGLQKQTEEGEKI